MADINGGALSFEVLINTNQLAKGLEEVKRQVADSTEAIESGGAAGDAAFQRLDAQVEKCWSDIVKMNDITDDALAKLTARSKTLGEQMGAAFMQGTKQGDELYRALSQEKAEVDSAIASAKKHKAEISSTAAALEKEQSAVDKMRDKTERAATAQVSLRTQLRRAVEQLAAMEAAGERGSEAYRELQEEAGRLKDAMGDATQQATILAHDNAGLQGVMSAVTGVSGAFTAAQGVISLFGKENENLQKTMLKVQSLMSVTMGLQQLANTLNKDSYFRIVTLTKVQNFFAAANDRTAAALIRMGVAAKTADVAAKTLTATLTLGLSVAIGAIIAVLSKMKAKNEEAREAVDKFNAAVADAAVKPVTSLRTLSAQWEKLGGDIKTQQKFVKEHADDFKELGVQVNSVTDAENILVKNKDKFIAAQMAKAKAIAATSIASEKAKELIQKQMDLEASEENDKTRKVKLVRTNENGEQEDIESRRTSNLREDVRRLNVEMETLYNNADRYNSEYIKNLEESGAKATDNATKETKTFLDKLQEKKKAYTQYNAWVNSTDEIARNAASEQFADILNDGSSYIDYLKRLRDNMKTAADAGGATQEQMNQLKILNDEIVAETNATMLDEFEAALKREVAGADNVIDALEIIKKKREELAGDDTDLDNGKSKALDEQQKQVEEQIKSQTESLIDEYAEYVTKKLEFEAEYADNMKLLRRRAEEAATDEERKVAEAAMKALEEERASYEKQTGDRIYDEMVEQYRNYQQKRADIEKEWDDKIANATLHGNETLVKELQKQKADALSSAALEELQSSDVWSRLFEQMDDLTTKEIADLIEKVKAAKLTLSADLDADDLNVIMEKLESAEAAIRERNPWKSLSVSLKNYKDEQSKGNFADIFKDIASITGQIGGIFDAVTQGLQKIGVGTDAVTQDLLSDIGDMAEGAGTLAMGIATGNPLQIVQGTISTITAALEVFNIKDRQADYSIQRHRQQVDRLEKAYDDLSRAVDKAVGSDFYKANTDLINNLKKQQEELKAMRAEEAAKKKADKDALDDYDKAIKDAGNEIEDTVEDMRSKLLGTSVGSIADELGSAIFDAFSQGTDAAEAWGSKVNDIVKSIMKNLIVQSVLTKPLQDIVDRYTRQWVDDSGNFKGWNVVYEGIENLARDLNEEGKGAIEAVRKLTDNIPDLFGDDEQLSSMSGAYKTASQESIDLLAGQTNAIRVQQALAMDIMRMQLVHLANIDTAASRAANSLASIERQINFGQQDELRAKGIITL